MKHTRFILASSLILITVAGILPTPASASNIFSEGFENCSTLNAPSTATCDPDPSYTFTSTGTNVFVSDALAHSGTKSLRIAGNQVTNNVFFNYGSGSTCSSGGTRSDTLWFYLPTLPAVGDSDAFWLSSSGTNGARFTISDTGAVSIGVTGTSGGSTNLALSSVIVPTTTWVDLTIRPATCTSTGTAIFQSNVLQLSQSLTAAGPWSNSIMSGFFITQTGLSGVETRNIFVDDISIDDTNVATPNANIWCSDPVGTNFDYDYLEGVTESSAIDISITPHYRFEGDSGNFDYLGKSITGSPTNLTAFFRIETAAEGASSVFRVNFGFIPATGTTAAPTMTKGNGLDTGDFTHHLELAFQESGNDWSIKAYQVDTTASINSRTQFGQGIVTGSPNTATSYAAELNTVDGTLKLYTISDQAPIGTYGPEDINNLIMNIDVLSGAGSSANDPIKELWFVGYSTNLLNAVTAMDEDRNTNFSSCIYDPAGVATFNGGAGTIPVPETSTSGTGTSTDAGFGVDGNALPPGFTVSAANVFLGVLCVGAVAGGFYGVTKSGLLAAIGALVGFILAFALGWFPLWVVLLLVLIVAAFTVMKFRSGLGA